MFTVMTIYAKRGFKVFSQFLVGIHNFRFILVFAWLSLVLILLFYDKIFYFGNLQQRGARKYFPNSQFSEM